MALKEGHLMLARQPPRVMRSRPRQWSAFGFGELSQHGQRGIKTTIPDYTVLLHNVNNGNQEISESYQKR